MPRPLVRNLVAFVTGALVALGVVLAVRGGDAAPAGPVTTPRVVDGQAEPPGRRPQRTARQRPRLRSAPARPRSAAPRASPPRAGTAGHAGGPAVRAPHTAPTTTPAPPPETLPATTPQTTPDAPVTTTKPSGSDGGAGVTIPDAATPNF